MLHSGSATSRSERLAAELDHALDELHAAPAFAKSRHQERLFATASDLMDLDEGVEALLVRAPRFEAAGVFHGGPWENPSRLIPTLVGASLKGEGVYPTVEALSLLRLVALAEGDATNESMTPADAVEFLGETSVRCLEFLGDSATEDQRKRKKLYARARRLFERIADVVPPERLLGRVVEEIALLTAQRPIETGGIEALIERAVELQGRTAETDERLDRFVAALGPATPLSRKSKDPIDYRRRLLKLDVDALIEESRGFRELLQSTGLASPYHAVLLRRIAVKDAGRVGEALAAHEGGVAESRRSAELVGLLVAQAIAPATRYAMRGLANTLDRGLLSRQEVAGGLRKIADLSIRPDIGLALLEPYSESSGLTANSVLLAGCLGVLGQPLGVGQGNNPTCQSARGISLWSKHAPGELLSMVASVARDGFLELSFEGAPIRSDLLGLGVAKEGVDLHLDPVSQVLVPHLDRIYNHMMSMAGLRGEDGHRWVNPALYGRWIATGFASAFELGTGSVLRHGSFVRRFFATHHPEHNEGHELLYPNPVGIMVTDVHGRLLGRHAVSIQRIALDPNTEEGDATRVYFYNPNNEGRQDWGFGVRPTVAGHGEEPGESSLPFDQFASRLYAFHFDPHEQGDAFAVPADVVEAVTQAAARSWGQALLGFA
ncbi:MAG: hypothetical protein WD226_05005 [Planctomycetota bacterium]